MIIDSYSVEAKSQRTFLSVQTATLTSRKNVLVDPDKEVSVTHEKEAPINPDAKSSKEENNKDSVTVSETAKDMYEKTKNDSLALLAEKTFSAQKPGGLRALTGPEELKIRLLEMILEMITGKKLKLGLRAPDDSVINDSANQKIPSVQAVNSNQNAPAVRSKAFEEWTFDRFQYESEALSYQAQGLIKTADGKTISVDISMNMSREFMSYTNVSVLFERQLCDPLVINYGGTAASLSGERFEFDLTMDGNMELLASLGEGSGFLALDKNGDGKINDGSELFGPKSGNGFGELREYDLDRNGWIDEADEIFSKLLIWSKDKDGNDQLFTLKDLGIGAIFLGDIDTEFSLNDSANQTLGVMRSTSFFLKENGGAGAISHVDLAV